MGILQRSLGVLLAGAMVAMATTSVLAHAPHDEVGTLVLSPDFDTDGTAFVGLQLTKRSLLGRTTDGGSTWRVTGPPMMVLGAKVIVFSPDFANDGIVFVGTTFGGLWRSTDGGDTWAQANEGLTSLGVRAVAPSPQFGSNGLVLAGTTDGLFRSTDSGVTWTPVLAGLTETSVAVAAWAPDGSAAWVGGKNLHVSRDEGLSWQVISMLPQEMVALAISPLDPTGGTQAVAFGRVGGGVLVSTDHGASFSASDTDLPDPMVNHVVFASDGTMFAATSGGGIPSAPGPFQPWSVSNEGLESLSPLTASHYKAVGVAPDFASSQTVLVASFEGVYISTDAGQSWDQQEIYTQRVHRLLHFSPDYEADGSLYVGNYGGGVMRYGLFGTAGGEPAGQPLDPPFSGPVAGGPLESGGRMTPLMEPDVGNSPWELLGTGVSLFSSILTHSPDFVTDRTMWYSYAELAQSTDGGRTWVEITSKPEEVGVVRTFTVSPDYAGDGLVFLGSNHGNFRSVDHGKTWQPLAGGLPTNVRPNALRVSPGFGSDGTAFVASDNDGVWRTGDRGLSWQPAGLQGHDVRALVMSPDFVNDEIVVAGTATEGLFLTMNRGSTWTPINTGIDTESPIIEGPITVEQIALSPLFGQDQTLFAAVTSHGFFRSTDGGASWISISAGLGLDAPHQVAVAPGFSSNQTVAVSNHGWVYTSHDAGDSWTRLPGYLRVDEEHQHARLDGTWVYVGPGLGPASASVSSCENDDEPPGRGGELSPLRFDHHGMPIFAGIGAGIAEGIDEGAARSFGEGLRRSTVVGDSTWMHFWGDRVDWHAMLTPDSGFVRIMLDDVMVGTFDLYSPTVEPQQLVFTKLFAEVGWHTIRVEVAGMMNPASSGAAVYTDGFAYSF